MAGLSYFDPRMLTAVVRKRPVKHDLFTSFFKPQEAKATEIFEIQTTLRKRHILPAITRYAAGTMMPSDELGVSYVKAPRFRPKRVFRAGDMLRVVAGRTPYDPLSNTVAAAVAEDMDAHREDIDTIVEIMCAQAAVYGKMDLYDKIENSDLVKTFTIDFHRPDYLNIELSGSELWSDKASDIVGQTEDVFTMLQDATSGKNATDMILGKNAWKWFRKHPSVVRDLDVQRLDLGNLTLRVSQKYKGTWNGLRIWVDNSSFIGLDGAVHYYMPQDYALIMCGDADNVIEYGMPLDVQCGAPTDYFAKQFEEQDPSAIYTIAESRPLPITRDVGWASLLHVVDDSSDSSTDSTDSDSSDSGDEEESGN